MNPSELKAANSPFAYYGWVIALVSTLCIVASIPGQTVGVSVFTSYLMKAYGLSRTELSLAYLVGTITSALMLPAAGRILDSIGPRLMILMASLGLAFFLVMIANAHHFIDGNNLLALGLTTIAFLGIRHFGQGQLTLVSRTVLGRWFLGYLGTVNGVVGIVISFSFGVAPMALSNLAEGLGWQVGLAVLGGVVILSGLLGGLFFRSSPEHMGCEIESGLPKRLTKDVPSTASLNLKGAKKTITFWVFNIGLALQGGIITGFTFHFSGICEELAIPVAEGFALFFPMALVATLVNIIAGFLADRIAIKWLVLTMVAALALTPLATPFMAQTWGYAAVALGFGVSGGVFTCLISVAWPKLFGRKFLGAISGYALGWVVFASAVYPYVVSLLKEEFGSLATAVSLLVVGPIALIAVILVSWVRLKPYTPATA